MIQTMILFSTSLNPCFGGRWSRSPGNWGPFNKILRVLILVLVEDGLGATKYKDIILEKLRLNPCFGGRWSRRSYSVCSRYNVVVS